MDLLKVIISIIVLMFIVGCNKSGEPVEVKGTDEDFRVQRLFDADGCTIFRFYDGGHYHYFVTCRGGTIKTYDESYQCGKLWCSEHKEEAIATRLRSK